MTIQNKRYHVFNLAFQGQYSLAIINVCEKISILYKEMYNYAPVHLHLMIVPYAVN